MHGIELSPAMVAQLRAKPGAGDIGVTIGDFARTTVDQRFTLAYLVRNTANCTFNPATSNGSVPSSGFTCSF